MTDDATLRQDLFLLLGYLLSSAHGLYDEPAGYGPLRLADAGRRLLTAMANQGMLDPYLERLQAALEEACSGAGDGEDLRRLLDELVLGYAAELRNRLGRRAT
jgi:hypothetical protein